MEEGGTVNEPQDKKEIRKWRSSKENTKITRAYASAYEYLNTPSEAPFFPSKMPEISGKNAQKIFSIFGGAPVYCSEKLDNVANTVLLFLLCEQFLGKDSLSKAVIGTSKRLLPNGFHGVKPVDGVYYLKQQLSEQVLFLKYMGCCLDKDPCSTKYQFEISLPYTVEQIIVSRLQKTTLEGLHNILDGLTAFFNTPVKKIRCMPAPVAVLFKISFPYLLFLSLNLPRNEQPTAKKIDSLLKSDTLSAGEKRYPAILKLLRPLCTAFYYCLSTCGGSEFAEAVKERYGLAPYVSENLLPALGAEFAHAAMSYTIQDEIRSVPRALTRRDPDTGAFDQKHGLPDYKKAPEEYLLRLRGELQAWVPGRSGAQIRKHSVFLNLFYSILSSVKCRTVQGADYCPNRTLNFILFEYTTQLATLARRGLDIPGSSFFPLQWEESKCQVGYSLIPCAAEASFSDVSCLDLPPCSSNPFYTIKPKSQSAEMANFLQLDNDECRLMCRLRAELLRALDCSETADKLREVSPLQNYLSDLFHYTPLLSEFHDRDYYGI